MGERAARSRVFPCRRLDHANRQQPMPFADSTFQQPLPIQPPPAKDLVSIDPCARATRATETPGSSVSSTIRPFSSTVRNRRLASLPLTCIDWSKVSITRLPGHDPCVHQGHHLHLLTLCPDGRDQTLTDGQRTRSLVSDRTCDGLEEEFWAGGPCGSAELRWIPYLAPVRAPLLIAVELHLVV